MAMRYDPFQNGELLDQRALVEQMRGDVAAPGRLEPQIEPNPQSTRPPETFERKPIRLMEGDPNKLDPSKGHQSKSPKYSFLQLANTGRYGYDQLGDMLKELQQTHPDFWGGWTVENDKFRYGGDPAKLHANWNGVREVDAVGGFRSGNPQGFRWGVDAPGAAAAPAALPASRFEVPRELLNSDYFRQLMSDLTSDSGPLGDQAALLRLMR